MPTTDIAKPNTRYRSEISTGISTEDPAVSREGGDQQAGLIRGYSVITRGEALGHGHWIDGAFLSQVADAINASPAGVKARFAHPSLSADGLGSFLGRTKNAFVDGNAVRADLHLSPAAHEAPDGDLADYVMDLAEVDPTAFGASIVFSRDKEAETQFALDNSDGEGNFATPDEGNSKNLRHVRLGRLHASDVVDEPAANPDGLFHRQSIAHEGESLLAYAFGLSEETPELTSFDIDPDRIRQFAAKFLESRGLQLTEVKSEPAQDPEPDAVPQEDPPAAAPQEETPADPTPPEQTESVAEEPAESPELSIASLRAQVVALQTAVAGLRGESQPLSFAPEPKLTTVDEQKRRRLQSVVGEPLGIYASSLKVVSKN